MVLKSRVSKWKIPQRWSCSVKLWRPHCLTSCGSSELHLHCKQTYAWDPLPAHNLLLAHFRGDEMHIITQRVYYSVIKVFSSLQGPGGQFAGQFHTAVVECDRLRKPNVLDCLPLFSSSAGLQGLFSWSCRHFLLRQASECKLHHCDQGNVHPGTFHFKYSTRLITVAGVDGVFTAFICQEYK